MSLSVKSKETLAATSVELASETVPCKATPTATSVPRLSELRTRSWSLTPVMSTLERMVLTARLD